MKKVFIALGCLLGVAVPLTIVSLNHDNVTVVKAESQETSESIVESTEISATTSESSTTESDWDKFVKHYLSAEKVAMYMSWLAYIGTIIGLVANINKLKKANHLTLENVKDSVQEEIEASVKKEMNRFLPDILKTEEKTNETLKIFSKILALSQDNTPESRVAILQLIEELGSVGKEITETAKHAVEEEVKAIKEHKDEVSEQLDNIIEKYDGTSI